MCNSPGDGHCFLYSVLNNLNSRTYIRDKIQYASLLDALEKEVVGNLQYYTPFINGSSTDRLLYGMDSYIRLKDYDTPFGDIVPHVVANALKIPILIVQRCDETYQVLGISQRENYPRKTGNYVLVFKRGKHYDGMVHVNGENINETIETSVPQSDENCMRDTRCLKIIVWNINGLSQSVLDERIVGSLFLKYDIIMLCETWANDDAEFFLNGYEYYNYPRKYKHRCAKRSSGGLGVFIRKNVREGVVIGGHTNDIIAWFVLKSRILDFHGISI